LLKGTTKYVRFLVEKYPAALNLLVKKTGVPVKKEGNLSRK